MAIKPEAVVAATAGLVMLSAGLLVAAGLASFLHWRADARQEVAMAAQARQSIAWETPGESRRPPPALRTEQVLFVPETVAGR